MKYKIFGRHTGLRVSELALGTEKLVEDVVAIAGSLWVMMQFQVRKLARRSQWQTHANIWVD